MRLALYQPDIAGNVGTIMRLAACMAVPLDIIEPCGFPLSDKTLRRAAMDYAQAAEVVRHRSAEAFFDAMAADGRRIVLLTSKGDATLYKGTFGPRDVLLLGSESAGVPQQVHDRAALRLRIPMAAGFRSLNIAVAAGIALGEALRQTESFPE